MSIWLGDKKLAGTSVKQSHNIGDIFFTSRTDTVLAGAVECNGATYQTTSYTGEGSIGELLRAGKLDYISLSAYSTAIAQTGWCDKIGWDGAGNTAFRVPTINPRHYIIKTQEPTAENNYTWYKLYADGWVEQGGRTSVFTNTANASSGDKPISLPVIMQNSNYTAVITRSGGSSGWSWRELCVISKTTSGFNLAEYNNSAAAGTTCYAEWQVSGKSSIAPQANTRAMFQLYNGVTDEALATCENVEDDVQSLKTTLDNKITNCITNIPQDIKLELNNGTLTLKAGSKVYIPNGAGVFDSITTSADSSTTGSASRVSFLVCCDESGLMICRPLGSCVSGAGATTTNGFAYNTTTNEIYYYNYASVASIKCSLPIGIVSTDANGIFVSIDQVFNGFGYIGSTVFALPGVKGLIPNGRNPDGSLKSTTTNDFTTVKTVQVNTSTAKIAMYVGGGIGSQTGNFELNEPENYNYDTGVLTNALEVARVTIDLNANIASFTTTKTAFHALDYNDSEYIAHQAMPGLRYIDLTLGASGVRYIAPADGYFHCSSDGVINMILSNQEFALTITGASGFPPNGFMPVRKGEYFSFAYSSNQNNRIRFYYAQGAQ